MPVLGRNNFVKFRLMAKLKLQNPIKEALLAALRIVVLAVIPLIVSYLEAGKEVDWRLIAVTATIALLKAVDEFIHTVGKNEKDEGLIKGLTRF